MKKALLVLSVLVFSATAVFGKEPVSTHRFKHYMHEIFKNYRNTNISINMRDYGLAEVHTRHFLENISKIPEFAEDLAADGVTLDQMALLARLDGLREDITEMRKALKAKDAGKIKKLQPEVLQACIGCHTEAKLKWLFRLPASANLFEEYMHEISENISMAEQLVESGEPDEGEDYVKIANQYLTLLKKVTPYEGPSGVILDRNRYASELRNAEGFMLLVLEDFKEKKPIHLEPIKKPLNNVCAACHEPAKVK
ncbi:MAG: hypothetical protein HZA03_09125 [Nitrospinae bacterium]|nr:hypothetical protein [Nitrospinota bacterium]